MYCSPMADARRYLPNQQLELAQILQEAKHRWLRPTEICEILRNYQKFQLTPDPPVTPPAGSLFLFDRKALRYFRKDGHRWRKKKDGKTVKEAHEKLKAGSVDALHCYYAHGEDNENFQRRSYWMLDGQLEHIVLVHYREVKEGYKSGVSRLLADPGSQVGSSNKTSTQTYSPSLTVQTSYTPTLNQADWNGHRLSSEIKNKDLCGDQGTSLHQSPFGSLLDEASPLSLGVSGFAKLSSNSLSGSWYAGPKFFSAAGSTHWDGVTNEGSILNQTYLAEHSNVAGFITHKLTDSQLDMDSRNQGVVSSEDRLTTDNDIQAVTTISQREIQHNSLTPSGGISTDQGENKSKDTDVLNEEVGELKKLDSFGRWMDKEIVLDCDDSLMASDSTNYWNSLDTDKEVSSLSRHMQLDIDSLGPSLSQEQLFSIYDFSPDWAYSGLATKVLVVGKFLGSKTHSTETKWGCMFGEIEVSAEVLTDNVIRCHTPSHDPGHVPFYVTCSNRLACSEVREFEYREMPMELAIRNRPEDELCIQIRLGKLLTIGPERQWLDCSVLDCQKCALRSTIYSMRSNDGNREWGILEEKLASENDNVTPRDVLIQNLLKDRLCEWLVCRVHEAGGGRGPNVLDDEGQGVIHLAAALGYEWAMDPIIAAGVSPNFRDKRGRTGLHWASYFGREETVVALVKLGAAPGAVDDPTPAFPGGQTAADLASKQGHKGIAGYLAEAYLTSHLSLLDINENVIESVATSLVAENLLETEANVSMSDFPVEQHSLKGSLAAVRNSVRAAALIQADFRNRSFRLREITKSNDDVDVASVDLVALGSLNRVPKMSHFDDYLHSAALSIQRKYRGWKGRREFLKIRNRIVKLQAHVRGHQVRNKYRKVVWSVSILEKVILRWRRKGAGLRGFRVVKAIEDVFPKTHKRDEYEFLRVGRKQKSAGVEKALERVKSMVRHPEAREQYMRLVSKSQEMGHEEKHGSKQVNN